MAEPTDKQSRARRALKRRAVMALVGLGLGLLCRVLPPDYHTVCNGVTKVVALLLGAS